MATTSPSFDQDSPIRRPHSAVFSFRQCLFLALLTFALIVTCVLMISLICFINPTTTLAPSTLTNTPSPPPPKAKPSYHASCFSRSEQLLLRHHGIHKEMPPLLAQALNRYGDLRQQCPIDAPSNQSSNDCKYLLFSDAQLCGLGNRFAALVSAMAYAIATDRVLLLDNRRQLGTLLCEPFPGDSLSWLLSPNSPYASFIDKAPSLPVFMANHKINFSNTASNPLQDEIVKVSLWDEPGNGDMEFFHEATYNQLKVIKWVVWESDLYTIPNLLMVPSFWRRMHPLFATREDEVFALLSHFILNPADDVWAMVLREYAAYMAGASTRVGVQIRLHGRSDRAMFDENAMSRIMRCLINRTYLPATIPGEPENQTSATAMVSLYGDKIQASRNASGGCRQDHSRRTGMDVDVAVLVASLQSEYFLRLKGVYSEGAGAEEGLVVRVHSVSGLKTQDFTLRQAQLALAEMWLLSGSERLAISASSTFGYMAQAWGGLRPLILSFSAGKEAEAVHFKPGYSTDPCSHLPRAAPAFSFTNLALPHRHWLLRHLRVCQDRPSAAWQLVPSGVDTRTAPPVFSLKNTPKSYTLDTRR